MDHRAREYNDDGEDLHDHDPDKMPVNQDQDDQMNEDEQGDIDQFIEIL